MGRGRCLAMSARKATTELAVWPSPSAVTVIPNATEADNDWTSVSDNGIAASGNVGVSNGQPIVFETVIARPPSYALTHVMSCLSSPVSVNDAGEVAGVSLCAGGAQPISVEDGASGSKVWVNDGYELNDNGDVAGQLGLTGQTGASSNMAAIEFANGTLENLPPLHAGDWVTVRALNDNDMAVGWEENPTTKVGHTGRVGRRHSDSCFVADRRWFQRDFDQRVRRQQRWFDPRLRHFHGQHDAELLPTRCARAVAAGR